MKFHEYYGLIKTDTHIKLLCLLPKVAFHFIVKENPRKIIFTSGTLPDKNVME